MPMACLHWKCNGTIHKQSVALDCAIHRPTSPEKIKGMRLILASASPRRRELLAQAGYEFEVRAAHVNEDVRPGEDPIAYVTRLARDKAEAVLQTFDPAPGPGREIVVLGADTTVTLDGHILAKPEDEADARRMLAMLSGRTHRVITGVAIASRCPIACPEPAEGSPVLGHGKASPETRCQVAAEVTAVRFLTLSPEEISAYVATGEPMDKAGAYAIQGRAARWIPRIEGDYFNVVGLPLALAASMLEMHGAEKQR